MPITKDSGRQWPIIGKVAFAFGDLVDAAVEPAMDIPAGATIVGGGVNVITAWDSVTSDSLDVGDAADPNRYSVSVVDLQTVGFTALDITGFKYATLDQVTVEVNSVGGSLTVGAAELIVEYVLDGRAHEVVPVQ